MTVSELMNLLIKNNISLDTKICTFSNWERGPFDMNGLFYNPDADCIEIAPGTPYDLMERKGLKCLSLAGGADDSYYDINIQDKIVEYYVDSETHIVKKRDFKDVSWHNFATNLSEIYNLAIDYGTDDEGYNIVFCPECGDPISEKDYPTIRLTEDNEYICPICGAKLEN